MKKFFDGKSAISFGDSFLLKPGWNEIPEKVFEHAKKRSMYIRTLIVKGLIRDEEEVGDEGLPEKYELDEMKWQDAVAKVEDTVDATLLQQWLVQEKERNEPRKSVIDAIEGQLKTLES